jgi:hypothetical protein
MAGARLTILSKLVIVLLITGQIGYLIYKFAPGLQEARQLEGIEVSEENVNHVTNTAELPPPSDNPSFKFSGKPLTRIAGYACNAQSGIILANGSAPLSLNKCSVPAILSCSTNHSPGSTSATFKVLKEPFASSKKATN